MATGTRASGAANSMHVILRNIGQVEVDDLGQLVNINTPCGNIGGDQYLYLAFFELGQGLGALGLTLIAVNGRSVDVVALEQFHQLIGAVLGAAKD